MPSVIIILVTYNVVNDVYNDNICQNKLVNMLIINILKTCNSYDNTKH